MNRNKLSYIVYRCLILGIVTVLGVTLLGCSSSPTQSSTGQFIDDSAITAKIKTKLLDDPQVRGTAISVETFKGIVQLSGFANSKEEISQAESLAKSVDGVRAVRNNITLK
ncbi:MAG: BON domain-containing protein [Nitrosomonas sp.]|nr:MAG: BON domain-containing protein [Nitrosomonas sp.]